jgi:hypothetical protein
MVVNQMGVTEGTVLVQKIVTIWTKKSRGSPGSIRRNSLPQAVALPLGQRNIENYALLEHTVVFHERSDFQDPRNDLTTTDILDIHRALRIGCVLVERERLGLRVGWKYDGSDAGIPDRSKTPQGAVNVGLNSWARVVYNGRFSLDWEGGWWYEKKIVNVGLFTQAVDSVFVNSTPYVAIHRMAKLF